MSVSGIGGRPVVKKLARLAMRRGEQARDGNRLKTARHMFSAALMLDPDMDDARRSLGFLRKRAAGVPDHLNYIVFGTTGTCNASCVHCPTGKASTALSPRGTMPMELFTGVIDEIVSLGLRVQDQIAFGLFGDGLVDPLVVERARYVREKLPDVRLSVNTNGAAFNRKRHGVIDDYASVVSLHCESLTPDTYDYLMAPLRAKNVHPKYEDILATFPGKVVVSVPVSRLNLPELPSIKAWFMERGAIQVVFDPMSSRCVEPHEREAFDRLSLNPQDIRCPPSIMADLIVDCDGLVLNCCQDFSRIEPIGDLSKESLAATLVGIRRKETEKKLAEGRHDEIVTCSRCVGDCRSADFPFDWPLRETIEAVAEAH